MCGCGSCRNPNCMLKQSNSVLGFILCFATSDVSSAPCHDAWLDCRYLLPAFNNGKRRQSLIHKGTVAFEMPGRPPRRSYSRVSISWDFSPWISNQFRLARHVHLHWSVINHVHRLFENINNQGKIGICGNFQSTLQKSWQPNGEMAMRKCLYLEIFLTESVAPLERCK